MAEQTQISWCDATFNPWIGCTRVSPACDDCYAARSTPSRTMGIAWGAGQPRHRTADETWQQPRRWARTMPARLGRRPRVFCASLADVFDNEVPPAWRAELFALIADTPELDWLLLTKRVGSVARMIEAPGMQKCGLPPNVWLGATVVDQAEADRDVPKLLQVPARVRFLSIEPMLGAIWLGQYLERGCTRHGRSFEADGKCEVCEGRGIWSIGDQLDESEKAPLHSGLHWVIAGGESGPMARPMHPQWVRSLRDQCAEAGVPFHFKQHGEWLPTAFCDDAAAMLPSRRTVYVNRDGSFVELGGDVDFFGGAEETAWVGKAAAGRLLDGVEHNGFPEA